LPVFVPGAGCSDSGVGGIIIIIIIIIIRSRQESEVQIARPCALQKIGKGSATVAEERGLRGGSASISSLTFAKVIHVIALVFVHLHKLEGGSGLLSNHLPRDQVCVVLHHAQDNLVPLACAKASPEEI